MVVNCSDCFNFQNSKNSSIIVLKENSKRHYIKYLKYTTAKYEEKYIVKYKTLDLKVDRLYYLEVANSTIDNHLRDEIVYSIIGQRRFSANDDAYDLYLLHGEIDKDDLIEFIKDNSQSFKQCRHDKNKNSYDIFIFIYNQRYFAYLSQTNISKRKTFTKAFVVELNFDNFIFLENIFEYDQKVDFIFTCMGKIYLDQQDYNILECKPNEKELETKITQLLEINDIEDSDNNSDIYSKLSAVVTQLSNAHKKFNSSCMHLINDVTIEDNLETFKLAIDELINLLSEFEELINISEQLLFLQKFIDDGKLELCFKHSDSDLRDIFLYILQCQSDWINRLKNRYDNIDEFNQSTKHLESAFRYLSDFLQSDSKNS
jgi:hypothetical protein